MTAPGLALEIVVPPYAAAMAWKSVTSPMPNDRPASPPLLAMDMCRPVLAVVGRRRPRIVHLGGIIAAPDFGRH
jgi:hypothetical protein